MGKRSDIDKAVRHIMKWAERPEWFDKQLAVFNTHLDPVCEHMGINQEELDQELADHGSMGMLFGIMFEDFLSRHLPPDDSNVIDDYLKRRGWRESVAGRRYLQQLRDSVLSIYEIVEVNPGHYCDLRDQARKGKTIRVHEHMGTLNMVKWDKIAARVINTNGKYIFTGGILSYPQEAARRLLTVLANSQKQFNKEFTRLTGKKAAAEMASEKNRAEQFLREITPGFTNIWLMYTLERLREPLPKMVNRDSEALVFTETRFPFLEEQFEEIANRLDKAPGWKRDSPDEHSWIWNQKPEVTHNKQKQGLAIDTFQDGQHLINGALQMTSAALTFTTNSMERAQRGQETLEALLSGLVGPALTKLQTPEQLMAENESHQHDDDESASAQSIEPEMAAEVISNVLDQHYRQSLDEPIPMLDDKSPRQCVKSKKGQQKVIEWLKHLENSELRRAASQGQKPYDSRWMWQELKLESTDNTELV